MDGAGVLCLAMGLWVWWKGGAVGFGLIWMGASAVAIGAAVLDPAFHAAGEGSWVRMAIPLALAWRIGRTIRIRWMRAKASRLPASLRPASAGIEFPPSLLECDDALAHLGFRGLGLMCPQGLGAESQIVSVHLSLDRKTVAVLNSFPDVCWAAFVGVAGDRRVVTTNHGWYKGFPSPLGAAEFTAPRIRDLERLYLMHCGNVLREFGGEPEQVEESEAIDKVSAWYAARLKAWAEAGLIQLQDGEWRFTRRAACRAVCWGLWNS